MIELIENILPIDQQQELENVILGSKFPWFFNHGTNTEDYREVGDTFQFGSNIFDSRDGNTSPFYKLMYPLIVSAENHFSIDVKQIIRIKANLLVKTSEQPIIHPPHIDVVIPPGSNIDQSRFLSMIYYVNDSDGDTILYDKFDSVDKEASCMSIINSISPQRGKAVIFDSNRLHSSSMPVLHERRAVLSFIFSI